MNWHVFMDTALLDPSVSSRMCLTLLHSLWQLALLGAVVWLIEKLWHRQSVQRNYALHVAALVLGLAVLPVNYAVVGGAGVDREDASGVSMFAVEAIGLSAPPVSSPPTIVGVQSQGIRENAPIASPQPTPTSRNIIAWQRIAPFLAVVYAIGVGLMLVRLFAGIVQAERLGNLAKPIADGPLLESLQSLSRRWSLRVVPVLAQAEQIVVPKVVGLLKPTILLPVSAIAGLSMGEMEMILAHELAHVRRHDMWVNLLQRLAEVVLFFNPALWYLSRRISTLREYCCDEIACQAMLETDPEPKLRYATALLRVVELAKPAMNHDLAALAASGRSPSELRRRVARLFGEPLREPVRVSRTGLICLILLGSLPFGVSTSWQASAQAPNKTTTKSLIDSLETARYKQDMRTFTARVVGPEGEPVAGADVVPWALRSSQGHRLWLKNKKDENGPPTLKTDSEGRVEVPYPVYSHWEERVATTEVTLRINHLDYVYISHEDVAVPWEEPEPFEITLERGIAIEVTPTLEGEPASLDGIYALWSDGRSWEKGDWPQATEDGALRIPPVAKGKAQLLLVKLQGEIATHFSPIVEVDLAEGDTVKQAIELQPGVAVHGQLSGNVPRPVKNGRIKVETISSGDLGVGNEMEWTTWVPVAEDGTFLIESWPADQPMQLVALCNGFIAESGERPPMVAPENDRGNYYRAQVFLTPGEETIEVPMVPMVRCEVETIDAHGKPLEGIKVSSCPNVGWWNGGSQIYCAALVRGERLLRVRDYVASLEKTYEYPFGGDTDASGRVSFELPVGEEDLRAKSDDYEMPIVLGHRDHEVTMVAGQTTKVRLVMQPKGTEQLGEWDSLSGLLFGCSNGYCQRILKEHPEFQEKMDELRRRSKEAADPRDPALLRDTYAMIADGLDEIGNQQESARWRRKAAEQAELVK